MASTKAATKPAPVSDSRGHIRIYADVPESVAEGLAIMAIRAKKSKKDMLADIITKAVEHSESAKTQRR